MFSLTVQLKIRHLLTQLNDQTVLFQTIQFSTSHLFVLSLNVKQFYLTQRWHPFRCYHYKPEWTWERWQWRGTPNSPKLQHYWSLAIRWSNVLPSTLIGCGINPLHRCSWCILHTPTDKAIKRRKSVREEQFKLIDRIILVVTWKTSLLYRKTKRNSFIQKTHEKENGGKECEEKVKKVNPNFVFLLL